MTASTSTSEPVTEAVSVSPSSIDDQQQQQQQVTETETAKETEKEKESLTESTESTVTTAPTVGKKIESIQSRRQKEDISSSNISSSSGISSSHNIHLSSISAPAGPKDAASIATSTSSSNGTSEKRTMSYFLKDSGEGREMPGAQSSAVTSTSTNSANSATTPDPALSPSKTRRIVNLRNIKAPPRSSTTSTALAPQVRVVDGAIVYDEKFSAAININNNSTGSSSYADLEQELEYIDEDDENGKHLTSATYSAKAKGSNRWNSSETDLFYEALSMCGTDFSMIQTLFPHRTRAQIKGKYKLEEKANPQRINDSLKSKKAFDPTFKDRVNELIKK